ncbi:hypothetical protein WJX72_005986 [[Myrmecia] bisecta]|uniref:Uncharacterized protein n=1 Tax=[Myrmecia] bisecta TaxID=41462 RepID=A0AAW1P8P8_9CHLO
MGLARLLVEKHSTLAKIVLPASIGFGFLYTMQKGTNPLTDASRAALGTSGEPTYTYSLKLGTLGSGGATGPK